MYENVKYFGKVNIENIRFKCMFLLRSIVVWVINSMVFSGEIWLNFEFWMIVRILFYYYGC